MKIAIMGYSGSGKSTLAGKLGEYYKCDVLHFDAIQFLPGWNIRPDEEKQSLAKAFLDTHESWVIDGNYSKIYLERRLEEADQIVLLLFGPLRCLYRVVKRYLKYRNQTRPDMGEGCQEKIDLEFVWWVLHAGRKKAAKRRYRGIMEKYAGKVVVLRNQKELDAWSKGVFQV